MFTKYLDLLKEDCDFLFLSLLAVAPLKGALAIDLMKSDFASKECATVCRLRKANRLHPLRRMDGACKAYCILQLSLLAVTQTTGKLFSCGTHHPDQWRTRHSQLRTISALLLVIHNELRYSSTSFVFGRRWRYHLHIFQIHERIL